MHADSKALTPLRRALRVDAGATAAMGLMLLVAAGPLAARFGIPAPVMQWTGLALLPFAGLLVWVASRPHISRGVTLAIVESNVLWVLASVLFTVSGWLTPTPLGVAFVLTQAAAVVLFVYLEYDGLRRAGNPSLQRAG